MNRIAQKLSLALAIFTFAGSVGIGVFTHFCHYEGIERSFIIPQSACCEDQHEEVVACCAHEVEFVESDCCTDEIEFFQVDFENFESSDVFTFLQIEVLKVQPFSFPNIIASSEVHFANYANPPPLWTGRQILIQHQIFRI